MSDDAPKPGAAPERGVGTGAVLGVRVLRNSGVQATAIGIASILHLATLFVIGAELGAADLGRYAIVFFGAGLVAQILTVASKPGTLRRTFGAGDDDDDLDDDDEQEGASGSPRRTLGTGILLASGLAVLGAAAAIILREPIASLALGDSGDTALVVWAALLAAFTVVFRLVAITIWLEQRPTAFMVCELTRPAVGLLAVLALLLAGAGLEAAIAGAAIGALAGSLVGVVVLRHSFEVAFDRAEALEILRVGRERAPIMMSFWSIGNLDVLLLAAFVSDAQLGVYTLASRFGFVGSFLPQGFRLGLRPLRKAAIYRAVEDEYGRTEQRGQLLGYFVLASLSAVTLMVLVSRVVVELSPPEFSGSGALVPLAALGMMGPAFMRTVKQQTRWPGRTEKTFIASAVGGAVAFVALTILLAPEIGAYAAPVGMIVGIFVPCVYLFVRCQRSEERIAFPYAEVARAFAVAAAVIGAYVLAPDLGLLGDAAVGAALAAAYVGLCLVLGVVPEHHRPAFWSMARSLVSGRPDRFQPRRGLRALRPRERRALRAAVSACWAAPGSYPGPGGVDGEDAVRALRLLRRVGQRGGMPVAELTERDEAIARYVFTAEPTAIRHAMLRRLLAEGADARDLRALEDLVRHLARVPDGAWEGRPKRDEAAGTRRLRRA